MDIYLDIDVIIDYLAERKPYAEEAEKIFVLIENGKINGNTSAHCFIDLFYLLRQRISKGRTITVLKELQNFLNLLKVDEEAVMKALDSDFSEFGDALQFHTAADYKRIDVIITRNRKDFKDTDLPVMSPGTFLKTYWMSLTN